MLRLVETWLFQGGRWEQTWEYSSFRPAILDCREVDDIWAVVGFRESGEDTMYYVPVLLANSAYAPAGELMALIRGERQEAT